MRHDLIGDGTIMKTVILRGAGYDRPEQYDEVTIDLKISSNENILTGISNLNCNLFSPPLLASPIVIRILQSMKVGEITSSVIKPDFLLEQDPNFAQTFPKFERLKPIQI